MVIFYGVLCEICLSIGMSLSPSASLTCHLRRYSVNGVSNRCISLKDQYFFKNVYEWIHTEGRVIIKVEGSNPNQVWYRENF